MSVGILAAVLLGAGVALTLLRAVWLWIRRRAAARADAGYRHPVTRPARVVDTGDATVDVTQAAQGPPLNDDVERVILRDIVLHDFDPGELAVMRRLSRDLTRPRRLR